MHLSMTTRDDHYDGHEDDDDDNDHPLITIGRIFQARVDESAGRAVVRAGSAWLERDWDGVADALGEASKALSKQDKIGGATTAPSDDYALRRMWQVMAREFQDISTIEGCSSVGPPASLPNWMSIQEELRRCAAEIMDGDGGKEDARWMEAAATEIDRLMDSI